MNALVFDEFPHADPGAGSKKWRVCEAEGCPRRATGWLSVAGWDYGVFCRSCSVKHRDLWAAADAPYQNWLDEQVAA